MAGRYLVVYLTRDGEEREERWDSVERFCIWARTQTSVATWTIYEQDDDEEWVVIDKGHLPRRR